LKLIANTETRWSSVYRMLERIFRLKPLLILLAEDEEKIGSLMLKSQEFDAVDELVNLLEPFASVTTTLQGDHYPTMASAYLLLRLLLTTAKTPGKISCVNTVRNILAGALNDRWANEAHQFYMPLMLDPRTKDLACLQGPDQYKAWKMLEATVKELEDEERKNESSPKALRNEPDELLAEDGRSLVERAFAIVRTTTPHTEIDRYRREPLIDPTGDPLLFWRQNHLRFPHLAKLARRYLAIQPTSAAAERVFSTAGNIISKKRGSLAPETACALVFGYQNHVFLE